MSGYYKNVKTGDITATMDFSSSSITISADYIRLDTAPLTWSVPSNIFRAGLPRTNCKNCGAPLPGSGVCRYCDTYNG